MRLSLFELRGEPQYCVSTVHSEEEVPVVVLRGGKPERLLVDDICCDCCKVEVNKLIDSVALDSCRIPWDRLVSREDRRCSLLEISSLGTGATYEEVAGLRGYGSEVTLLLAPEERRDLRFRRSRSHDVGSYAELVLSLAN